MGEIGNVSCREKYVESFSARQFLQRFGQTHSSFGCVSHFVKLFFYSFLELQCVVKFFESLFRFWSYRFPLHSRRILWQKIEDSIFFVLRNISSYHIAACPDHDVAISCGCSVSGDQHQQRRCRLVDGVFHDRACEQRLAEARQGRAGHISRSRPEHC